MVNALDKDEETEEAYWASQNKEEKRNTLKSEQIIKIRWRDKESSSR